MDEVSFDCPPAPFEATYRLVSELGVDPIVAQTLVRRGLEKPDAARRFLACDEEHPASAFEGIDEACALVEQHVAAGSRIVVHGDYDADGVCSTAILVGVLREMGADAGWFIPGRREDGYGLASGTVERLAADGAGLVITADCGITSVDEVALAHGLGLDVVVTDHHRERADGLTPDCPIVHPRHSGYPFEDLCAAAVAQKFASHLRDRAGLAAPALDELDLVAIATVADCVPLVGENRRIVRDGLRALAATRRPGLRSLMRVSGADPGAIDEQTIGFRLAPRINAAGRVERADPAVELLLTADDDVAERCAAELDTLNAERRHIETRIRFEAESQISAAGPQPGYVLASDQWHPGVIGITASRLSERHGRPVVLIAIQGEAGTGSGRSVPGFDLLAALDASSEALLRHGGHAAAAGCTVAAADVERFRALFTEACRRELGDEPAAREVRVDAVSGPGSMTLETAVALGELAPFGVGNERPVIMLPGVRLTDARTMGEGRHLRCSIQAGNRKASAVLFGSGSLPPAADGVADVACNLEVNRWQGREEPRVLIDGIAPAAGPRAQIVGQPDDEGEAIIESIRGAAPPAAAEIPEGGDRRRMIDSRDMDPMSVTASLGASGESTLLVTRDAHRLRRRFDGLHAGVDIVSWPSLRADPGLATPYEHLVAVDPPLAEADARLLEAGRETQFSHLAWSRAELRSIIDELQREQDLRAAMVDVYRAARQRPNAPVTEIVAAGDPDRPAELCAVIAAVLEEIGVAQIARDGSIVLLECAQADLERSELRRRHAVLVQERLQWLSGQQKIAA